MINTTYNNCKQASKQASRFSLPSKEKSIYKCKPTDCGGIIPFPQAVGFAAFIGGNMMRPGYNRILPSDLIAACEREKRRKDSRHYLLDHLQNAFLHGNGIIGRKHRYRKFPTIQGGVIL